MTVPENLFSRHQQLKFCCVLCRLLRFEGMIGEDEDLPWDARDACFVRKAQTLQAKSTRMVFLMGRHLRWWTEQLQCISESFHSFRIEQNKRYVSMKT